MLINQTISLVLAANMFINSGLVWVTKDKTYTEPITEELVCTQEVVEEPITDIIVEPVIEPETIEIDELPLSDEEINLIALVTMAEAEGESEEGKRLVIDVILNRLDSHRFPNTVYDVLYAKNAFECLWDGRINRCHVRDDIRQLVIEELGSRTNSNIHYFRANHYHGFGTPVVQVGNHYFSTY